MLRLDKRLRETLVTKLKQREFYEDSVIVVLGDHSSIDGHTTYTQTSFGRSRSY